MRIGGINYNGALLKVPLFENYLLEGFDQQVKTVPA